MINYHLQVKRITLYEVDVVVLICCMSSKQADVRDKSFGRVKTGMIDKY